MLEMIRTPELAAEVTLLPIDAFGSMRRSSSRTSCRRSSAWASSSTSSMATGPRIANPIARPHDVDLLGTPPAEETMTGTLEAIRIVARELGRETSP